MRICLLIIASALLFGCEKGSRPEPGTRELFDSGWLFYRGDVANGERPDMDDSQWRKVDLPHDWSIEDIPGTGSPFDSTVVNGIQNGFTRGGYGWYRKHFRLDPEDSNKTVKLLFEGIYMNSVIWVNGKQAGSNFYGFSSFPVDLTPYLNYGSDNLIAVRVDNNSVKCRWYSGSGIYRHVWLSVAGNVNIDTWGVRMTTPEISEQQAVVMINSRIRNEHAGKHFCEVKIDLIDPEQNEIASQIREMTLEGNDLSDVDHKFTVQEPQLWNTVTPRLYQAKVTVLDGGKVVDTYTQNFGIRKIEFDAKNGFRLNGVPTELKGGCIHHDNGPLGACAYDRAEERKIELLKSAGFNTIRFAHNPPSPAILDACDRLGMMAIDESFDVWRYGHYEGDYGSKFDSLWARDIEYMVRRDRNHPSVIMWSIGNEITNSNTTEIAALCGELANYVRSLDATRPVTSAANQISEEKDAYLSHLDISGYNYSFGSYEADHTRLPERVMYGSESFALEAYDNWKSVSEFPWVIGDFVWTAYDHIGEASIGWRGYPHESGFFPWKLAYCGDLNLTGERRPQSYYRQTIWDTIPITALFVEAPSPSFPPNPNKAYWSLWDWPDVLSSWTFPDFKGNALKAVVYSQCDEVELFLNGKSLGKKSMEPENKNRQFWEVPYEEGKLTAVGYKNKNKVAESFLETAGTIEKIELTSDRKELIADGQDLCFIELELKDAKGTLNPLDDRLITFEVSGAGTLAAVANANPVSSESFQQPRRMTWRGKCMVIIRAGNIPGEIKITARSENLPDKEILIMTN